MAGPKICKSCGNVINPGPKYCPICGAKVPQGLPTWATVVIVIIAALIMIGLINSGKSENPDPTARSTSTVTPKPTSTPRPTPTPEPTYTIGDTIEYNDLRITLHDVRNNYGSGFLTPDSGMTFLVFDIEIENNRDDTITVSSLLCFTAYADDYALELSLSGMTADSGKQMDGEIAAGKKMRGVVAFNAPEDWQTAEIHFKPSAWSGHEFVFTASR